MNDNPIVLVSGVSGVGKTKLCRQFIADQKSVHINYINAGEIAAKLRYPSQRHLCRYMYTNLLAVRGRSIVDGHMYLPIGPVPTDAIAELKICGIIVLSNDPETIETYRISDSTRTRRCNARRNIGEEQDREIENALNVGRELEIQVKVVNSSDYHLFCNSVAGMLNL